MPIYEYCCQDCEQIFEEWQKSFDDEEAECPACKGKAKRIMSSTSFVLKGSGWYVTDYSGKNPTKSDGSSNGDSGNGSSASSEGSQGNAESKSDAAPASASSSSTTSASADA